MFHVDGNYGGKDELIEVLVDVDMAYHHHSHQECGYSFQGIHAGLLNDYFLYGFIDVDWFVLEGELPT